MTMALKEVLLIKPDADNGSHKGSIEVVQCDLELDSMYRLLGCEMVEIRHINDKEILVFDEEGRIIPKGKGSFYFGVLHIHGWALVTGVRNGIMRETSLTPGKILPFIHWGNL